MRIPQTFPATAVGGATIVAAGVLVGSIAGRYAQTANGTSAQSAGASIGGFLGGMIAGVGGLAAGFADPQYDKVGRMSALLAFGGLTAMASLAAVRPGGVFSQQVAPGAPSQITPAPKATPASTSASQIALPSGIVQQ